MPTQKESNPFPFSDTNKRYHTYEYAMRRRFCGRVVKIPLDAGFTCPNLDGKKGRGGCAFCGGGAGDFAGDARRSIEKQYETVRAALAQKWDVSRTVPYFQVHTNTYAPIGVLEDLFTRAANLPGAVALAIGTRGDCISVACAQMLSRLAKQIPITVELGLQTACDATSSAMNRCESYGEFLRGYRLLRAQGNLSICLHLMIGLPGETRETVLDTVKKVAALRPDEVKFHALYVLEGTPLSEMLRDGSYTPLTEDEYVETLCDALTLLPPETVVSRVTGDAPREKLVAPEWSARKREVVAKIDRYLFEHNKYQGQAYSSM